MNLLAFQRLKNIHVAYWNLVYGSIAIVVLFSLLPILKIYSKGTDDVKIESESNEIKYAGVALLVASCTMIVDLIMDTFSTAAHSSEMTRHVRCGRTCYSLAAFMTGLQFVLKYDYFHVFSSYESSFWFGFWCFKIVVTSTLMFFVSITSSNSATFRKTAIVTIWGCCGLLLQVFDNILKYPSMTAVARLSTVLWVVFCLILFIEHNCQMWKTRVTWSVSDYANFSYVNLVLFKVVFFGMSLLLGFFQYLSNTTSYVIIPHGYLSNEMSSKILPAYIYVVITIILSIVPGRIAKYDAITSKDHIIATKQAYVRYISHELRTPLNSVHMGVQFCIEQIPENSRNIMEKERLDILTEVNIANGVALEILNDLLLYDKLQSGLVSLQKEEITVIDWRSGNKSEELVEIIELIT